MTISATEVRFDPGPEGRGLRWGRRGSSGRSPGMDFVWFLRLLEADAAARAAVEFIAYGLHWAALDEDISVDAGQIANPSLASVSI